MSENWLADAVATERKKTSKNSLKVKLISYSLIGVLLAVVMIGVISYKPTKTVAKITDSNAPSSSAPQTTSSPAAGSNDSNAALFQAVDKANKAAADAAAVAERTAANANQAAQNAQDLYQPISIPAFSLPNSTGTISAPTYTYTPPTPSQTNCNGYSSSIAPLFAQLNQYETQLQQLYTNAANAGLSGAQIGSYIGSAGASIATAMNSIEVAIRSVQAQYPGC